MSHPKHDEVRRRYAFQRGYCGVSEVDTGGELTVDHYIPVSEGGDDEDENLVYCCFRCNNAKGAILPVQPSRPPFLHILHPLRDLPQNHYIQDDQTGLLNPLTESGRSHIAILDLNRPGLILHRRHRMLLAAQTAEHIALQEESKALQEVIEAQDRYIKILENLVAHLQSIPPDTNVS